MKTHMPRFALPACSLLFTALSITTGCVAGDEEGDGIDDSFLGDSKADAFGVAEGSPDALAVLGMLRTASLDELDDAAGLASNAAKAIVRHRQGGDRKDGTADDDSIDSLTELDAVPYVGPIAFRLLLDHARASAPVPSSDPFDPTFCGQDYALTGDLIRATVPEGEANVNVATTSSEIRVRTRTCATPESCTAWTAGSQPNMFHVAGASTPTSVGIPASGVGSTFAVGFLDDGRPGVIIYALAQVEGSSASALLGLECYPSRAVTDGTAPLVIGSCLMTLDQNALELIGEENRSTSLVGTHCTQLIQRRTIGTTQIENVFFARY
jgi:hypothetical protein